MILDNPRTLFKGSCWIVPSFYKNGHGVQLDFGRVQLIVAPEWKVIPHLKITQTSSQYSKKNCRQEKCLQDNGPGGGCEYCRDIERAGGESERTLINSDPPTRFNPKNLTRTDMKLTSSNGRSLL